MQIKVTRVVEFGNQQKLGKGCIFVQPGVYELEVVTLSNPRKPGELLEFYRIVGMDAVMLKKRLEETLNENFNNIQIQPTEWIQKQTNSLLTNEDKLIWVVERLTHLQGLTSLSRGQDLTLDAVLNEIDALASELQTEKMVDRGIID